MSASPTPQFEVPNEMRAVAERSIEQAKVAFQQLMQAAEESVSTLEERGETSQVGALDISKKATIRHDRRRGGRMLPPRAACRCSIACTPDGSTASSSYARSTSSNWTARIYVRCRLNSARRTSPSSWRQSSAVSS